MTNLDSLIEFLAKENLTKLELLAADPTAAANSLAKYLPDAEPAEQAPDSQEAEEAASVEAQYLAHAGWTWRRLAPAARASLSEIFAKEVGLASATQINEYLQTQYSSTIHL